MGHLINPTGQRIGRSLLWNNIVFKWYFDKNGKGFLFNIGNLMKILLQYFLKKKISNIFNRFCLMELKFSNYIVVGFNQDRVYVNIDLIDFYLNNSMYFFFNKIVVNSYFLLSYIKRWLRRYFFRIFGKFKAIKFDKNLLVMILLKRINEFFLKKILKFFSKKKRKKKFIKKKRFKIKHKFSIKKKKKGFFDECAINLRKQYNVNYFIKKRKLFKKLIKYGGLSFNTSLLSYFCCDVRRILFFLFKSVSAELLLLLNKFKVAAVSFNVFFRNFNSLLDTKVNASIIVKYIIWKLVKGFPINLLFKNIIRGLSQLNFLIGFKLCFSGRFTRNEIATYRWSSVGLLKFNMQDSFIDFAFSEYISKFGICGIKLWLVLKK